MPRRRRMPWNATCEDGSWDRNSRTSRSCSRRSRLSWIDGSAEPGTISDTHGLGSSYPFVRHWYSGWARFITRQPARPHTEARVLKFRDGELTLDHTVLMGIVNVTPDSFSDGGRFADPAKAVAHAVHLADEGAEILDVGGESTRPGAEPVSAEEEWRRVEPVLKALRPRTDARISIDTYKPEIAAKALALRADMVNDVHGLGDPHMVAVLARERAAVVVMHMHGEPKTMQESPTYNDVVLDVLAFLAGRTRAAIFAGVASASVVIDPGLGFGK